MMRVRGEKRVAVSAASMQLSTLRKLKTETGLPILRLDSALSMACTAILPKSREVITQQCLLHYSRLNMLPEAGTERLG